MKKCTRLISAGECINCMLMCLALLISLLLAIFTNEARAADAVQRVRALAEINIRLSGNIVALGCTVDPMDVNKTVTLGDWATKQLSFPSGHSEPVAFRIHLTGCTASGVALAFTGKKNNADNTLLALSDESTASGVAVEIMDAAHKRIPMGESTQRVTVDSMGDAILNFSARYVAVSEPSAGTADADTEFTLTYD
ncbi:fimbrial protein [Enterobacter bugandensis]